MSIVRKLVPNFFKSHIRLILFKLKNKEVRISRKCNISPEVNIGKGCSIGESTYISRSKIGEFSYFSSSCHISSTEIGSFCSIGPNVKIGLGSHPTDTISTSPIFYSTKGQLPEIWSDKDYFIESENITIGDNVLIGANVVILDGVNIGEGAIIATGAVVTKDVQPYSIVGGIPAKFIKHRMDKMLIARIVEMNIFSKDENWLKKNMIGLVTPEELICKLTFDEKSNHQK